MAKSPALAGLLLALVLAGCARETSDSNRHPVTVVATFSTLGSLVKAVAGPGVRVTVLVPVGASPEDYQPTPADIRRLHEADLLVENGGGIESWLDRTVENAKNPHMQTVVLSAGLPMKDGNPHLWMDPVLAQSYVSKLAAALSSVDPAGRQGYEARARAFNVQLDALRREIAQQIATIPPDHRTMIVFHNAWQYYNDRFGLRTIGVIELSPGQEPSPKYIADLILLARRSNVRAVFAEPEYSPKLVQALAQGAGIATVENLYDDSLSTSPEVHDYPSMLRYDTQTIVRALR
jgi:manganese/iron transport system substrate-binding protein